MWLLELAAAFFALGGFASTAAQYRIDENFRDDDGLNSLQLIAFRVTRVQRRGRPST